MSNTLLQDEAAAVLDAGCQVVSTAHPGISGTYPCDEASLNKLAFTAMYILANQRFPAAQTTWQLRDINGIAHTIPTTAVFLQLVTALADYVAQLYLIIDGLSSATTLPALPANMP